MVVAAEREAAVAVYGFGPGDVAVQVVLVSGGLAKVVAGLGESAALVVVIWLISPLGSY